jgi:ketosteroid isomerase-like protein
MKKYIVIVAVVFAFATTAFSQTNNGKDQKTEQEIIKIMSDWGAVAGQRDIAATSRFLPEDFTMTDCDGKVSSKTEYLEGMKNARNLPNFVITDSEQKVRVFGKTAVITARYTVTADDQKRLLGAFRYMTVFQKQGGRWMPIAFQRVCQAKQ